MPGHLGVERTWEVAETALVPDLSGLPEVASVDRPRELESVSVYYDTETHALLRAGISLQRCIGSEGAGWHLERAPDGGSRQEPHEHVPEEEGPPEVPSRLRALVQVQARGRSLRPVATVRRCRVVHRLLRADGTAVGVLSDDHLHAESSALDGSAATLASWREWKLELADGDRTLLDAGTELFQDAGARPATSGAKLARVVGAPSPPATGQDPAPSEDGPAAVVVWELLRSHADTLKAIDPAVRREEVDSVHKMRVTTRRLRSALTTFAPLLDATTTDRLRTELRWLAEVLGRARDAEVMRDRLVALATATALEPPPSSKGDTGPCALRGALQARYAAAYDEVLACLDSERYYRLLDMVDAAIGAPPWTAAAAQQAATSLRASVRREWRRLAQRAASAQSAQGLIERDRRLHEVRKAAKRLRYACEGLTPTFGHRAAALGRAAKELQEVLGEHRDSMVSQQLLRVLAEHGSFSGDDALMLGRMHLVEERNVERSVSDFETVWREASDKRLRRWLKS